MTVRRILSIFLVLGVIISLFGCTPNQNEPGETGEPTDSESGGEYDPTGDDKAFELESELVENLDIYRAKFGLMADIANPPPSFKEKLNSITSSYLVRFSSSEQYYACLYGGVPGGLWVGFRNPEEIKENYLGLTLIFAVQVNVTNDVTRVSGDTQKNIRMYYYTTYIIKFENGFNVCSAEQVRPFIYFKDLEGDVVYYGCVPILDSYARLVCYESEEEVYILIATQRVAIDGTLEIFDRQKILGEYYDDLADLIVPDVYSGVLIVQHSVYTYTYAGIKLSDFLNVLDN